MYVRHANFLKLDVNPRLIFLDCRLSCQPVLKLTVRHQAALSSSRSISRTGSPQGTVLSPILFTLIQMTAQALTQHQSQNTQTILQ